MMFRKSSVLAIACVAGITIAPAAAQDVAPPADVPQEVVDMFGGNTGGDEGTVTYAAPDEQAQEMSPAPAATLAGDRYIYHTLRVITSGASRGCSSGDWNCMTNLCKSDLGQSAWRGWAGCWKKDSSYICYFECGQTRNAF